MYHLIGSHRTSARVRAQKAEIWGHVSHILTGRHRPCTAMASEGQWAWRSTGGKLFQGPGSPSPRFGKWLGHGEDKRCEDRCTARALGTAHGAQRHSRAWAAEAPYKWPDTTCTPVPLENRLNPSPTRTHGLPAAAQAQWEGSGPGGNVSHTTLWLCLGTSPRERPTWSSRLMLRMPASLMPLRGDAGLAGEDGPVL